METNVIKTNYKPILKQPLAQAQNETESCDYYSMEKLMSFLIQYISYMKKKGHSLNIISAARGDLILFCAFLAEKQINPNNYPFYQEYYLLNFLKENGKNSKASLRRIQTNANSFLHFLSKGEIFKKFTWPKLKSPEQALPVILTVPHNKFVTLCRTLKTRSFEGDSKAIRDWALFLILGECGLKATEVAGLTWGDISFPEKNINEEESSNIKGYLKVQSNKTERYVPYFSELEQALKLLKEVRTNLNLSTALTSNLFFGFMNVSRKTRSHSLKRHGIKYVVYENCLNILGSLYNSESLRNHAIFCWIGKGFSNKRIAELAGYTTMTSMLKFYM